MTVTPRLSARCRTQFGRAQRSERLLRRPRGGETRYVNISWNEFAAKSNFSIFARSRNHTGPGYSRGPEGLQIGEERSRERKGPRGPTFPLPNQLLLLRPLLLRRFEQRGGGRSGTATHQENHNQPIARIYKRGLPGAKQMPAAAGAPLSQLYQASTLTSRSAPKLKMYCLSTSMPLSG